MSRAEDYVGCDDEFERRAAAMRRVERHRQAITTIECQAAAKPPITDQDVESMGAAVLGVGVAGVIPPVSSDYLGDSVKKLFHGLAIKLNSHIALRPSTLMYEIEVAMHDGGAEDQGQDPLT